MKCVYFLDLATCQPNSYLLLIRLLFPYHETLNSVITSLKNSLPLSTIHSQIVYIYGVVSQKRAINIMQPGITKMGGLYSVIKLLRITFKLLLLEQLFDQSPVCKTILKVCNCTQVSIFDPPSGV